MNDNKKIEEELRSQRKFSMMDGLAQSAKGMFKDASVVPALTQAQTKIGLFIRGNLRDSSGAMSRVLEARLKGNDELVGSHLNDPLVALNILLKRLLDNEHRLFDFVREVDQKYGQMFQERPHFQRPGQEAHPDDEYTHQSVKESLEQLFNKLNSSHS
ncbi:MAG: hypothetical protein KAG61_08630 [Bacteriovoracaceae bacterium]|nr:hypothetical protein [Bacteriovoracaceae bacterium]